MSAKKSLVIGSAIVALAGLLSFVDVQVKWPVSATANSKAGHWTEKAPSASTTSQDEVVKMAGALNKLFIDLNKSLSPAVVNVYTKTRSQRQQFRQFGGPGQEDLFRFFFGNPFEDFSPAPRESQSLGSGFVIHEQGIVVTNSHVVRPNGRNADSVMLKFVGDPANSQGVEAEILGVDETTDVAVLKLKKKRDGLRAAPLGNSDSVQVGEWVIAIGNPYGHAHTVTQGIVSALGRDLGELRAEFLQTSASINPGNSGGPLININGEVIGINTAIDARAQGIGFAIPINTAKNAIRQIIEKGEVTLGWIGVGISDVDDSVSRSLGLKSGQTGVLIQNVFPGEPADRAGVKVYDVVTAVNGKTVQTSREFSILVGNLPVGTKVKMSVLRDGKSRELEVTVAKRKSEAELARRMGGGGEEEENSRPSQNARSNRAGLAFAGLTPEMRRRFGIPADAKGVLVRAVLPGSPAAEQGLQPGDLIIEINRKPVSNPGEANSLLSKKTDGVLVRYQRGPAVLVTVLDLSEEASEE